MTTVSFYFNTLDIFPNSIYQFRCALSRYSRRSCRDVHLAAFEASRDPLSGNKAHIRIALRLYFILMTLPLGLRPGCHTRGRKMGKVSATLPRPNHHRRKSNRGPVNIAHMFTAQNMGTRTRVTEPVVSVRQKPSLKTEGPAH